MSGTNEGGGGEAPDRLAEIRDILNAAIAQVSALQAAATFVNAALKTEESLKEIKKSLTEIATRTAKCLNLPSY
jgi:hypothetical protein